MLVKLHKILALLATLGVVCTPVFAGFAGKVLCTTDTGHSAIEAAHGLTGCPETAGTDQVPAEKSDPCEDRDLVGDLVSQSVKASSASIDTACLTLSLIPSPLTVSDSALSPALRVPLPCHQFPPTDHGRLATVILLI